MLRCVTLLVLLLGLSFVACELGSINFSFTDEDPATGLQVDTTLLIGDSIEVTIILTPPPDIPVQIDIVSTVPNVVYPTHNTITFNRGVSRGVVTLESPEDGKIGVSTILVSPKKLGLYRPGSFTVLVQGIATLTLLDDCVAAGKPATFEISVWPASPDNDVFTIHSSNGAVSTNSITLDTGETSTVFTFTGLNIGTSSITIESDFYPEYTLEFQTLGRIISNSDHQAVEGAPEPVLITVNPALDADESVHVTAITGNAEVLPSPEFDVGPAGTHIEVRPIYYGIANVTYTAEGYCPLYDIYLVAEAPLCASNSHENLAGDECYVCPGNLASLSTFVNNCNDHGNCTYTHCFDDEVTCECDPGYLGYACQWNIYYSYFEISTAVLDDQPFVVSVSAFSLPSLTSDVEFSAPGDLIDESLQPGLAITAPYPFFGAIDPADEPPMGAEYTGISFYWENTCYENAYIPDNFTAAVEAKFPLDPEVFTHRDLLEVQLCLFNSTSGHWVDSIDACHGAGIPGDRTMDLHSFTFNTLICQPGQYALFKIPISSPVPNTGNTNDPHPGADAFSDTFFLVSSGWQPAPPLPLPVVAADFDPSPPLPRMFGSDSSASALVLSLSVILLAFLLHL